MLLVLLEFFADLARQFLHARHFPHSLFVLEFTPLRRAGLGLPRRRLVVIMAFYA